MQWSTGKPNSKSMTLKNEIFSRGIQTVTQLRENPRRGRVVAGVVAFIVLFAIHLALTSHANTVTWDEPDHIYSGYMSWQGDFGLNPEHPPLVKFVATLPLLGMQLNVPELQDRPYRLQAVLGGRDFIFHNDADKVVFRAQLAASIFTLLLLVIVFLTCSSSNLRQSLGGIVEDLGSIGRDYRTVRLVVDQRCRYRSGP